ncbi:uncharacterized protein N7511_009012 [Penicillium nucicola]|uniref:uncharacterized protein n=1 Tax=Penicillium nucicola TaxID=1850975 RepID=UPI0025454FC2|nr:uncharacterized protein N7511_009012 [Penicillium nucicola]KAJ5747316.1 hypothetical protein N7511_009012 [Penicillium nucicola]
MPSQYSHAPNATLAHLSEIIKLEPEEEPWCAGYAHSQGRRCHSRTNAHGRRIARVLLNDGTKDLRAGRSIDALLDDLAPRVLCTRFHQNQSSDLSRRWKRQVSEYLDSQVPSSPSPQRTRRSSRDVDTETAESRIEAEIAVLQQTLRAMKEIRRLEVAQNYLSTITTPLTYNERRDANAVVNSNISGTVLRRSTSPVNLVDRTTTRQTTESSNRSTSTVSRSTRVQSSHQTRTVSPFTPTIATSTTVVRDSGRPRSHDTQDQASRTTRRNIEGECGICLCDLIRTQQDVDVHEESEHIDNEDHSSGDQSGTDHGYNEQRTEHVHGNEDDGLAWCMARCGVNFHSRCIEQWLETARTPTCPACRSMWRY